MQKALLIEVGKRYYDSELEGWYDVWSIDDQDVIVKFENHEHVESFDYADLLRDAYVLEPAVFTIPIQLLHPDAVVPEYQTAGAAGFDLHITEDITVPANTVKVTYHRNPFDEDAHLDLSNYEFSLANDNHAIAGTGLAFEIPVGYELEIRGRSGLAFKFRIISFNGTIDSDYRGEVKLLITNLGKEPISFKKGDRVAQGVIKKIDQAAFVVTDKLSETERATGGFGSTGVATA